MNVIAYLVAERRDGQWLLVDDWTQRCDTLAEAREIIERPLNGYDVGVLAVVGAPASVEPAVSALTERLANCPVNGHPPLCSPGTCAVCKDDRRVPDPLLLSRAAGYVRDEPEAVPDAALAGLLAVWLEDASREAEEVGSNPHAVAFAAALLEGTALLNVPFGA